MDGAARCGAAKLACLRMYFGARRRVGACAHRRVPPRGVCVLCAAHARPRACVARARPAHPAGDACRLGAGARRKPHDARYVGERIGPRAGVRCAAYGGACRGACCRCARRGACRGAGGGAVHARGAMAAHACGGAYGRGGACARLDRRGALWTTDTQALADAHPSVRRAAIGALVEATPRAADVAHVARVCALTRTQTHLLEVRTEKNTHAALCCARPAPVGPAAE